MRMESSTGILPVESGAEQGQDGPATHGPGDPQRGIRRWGPHDAHATGSRRLKRLLTAALILVTLAGCKPRGDASRQSGQTSEPAPAEVATVRDALTKGMQQTTCDSLAAADVGKQCVVTARAEAEGTGADQAPPPLGMVYRLGQIVIYKGEIQQVLPDGLKIRAAYPTSGRYKTIEIPRSDIQSLHVAKPSPG